MRKAIALCRVSTDAQGREERGGLPGQRAECQRIATREGLALAEWVELRGVSGTEVREDPRFQALLARLADPGVAGVIVADFDRLFRRGRFADYMILDAFADSGSLLFTSEGMIDPREDTGGLLSVMRGEFGAMERKRIADRTWRSKEERRKAGRHVSGPVALPYGITYRFEAGRPVWSTSPAEGAIVREVFARVLAGERNFSAIARELGLVRTLVSKILRNRTYAGVRRIDRRAIRRRAIPRAPGDVIETDLAALGFAPLVSPADWTRVQEILERRPRAPLAAGFPGILAGFAECAPCRTPMHAHADRATWAYRCRAQATGDGCETGSLNYRAVDGAADEAIGVALARPEVVGAALAAVLDEAPAAEPVGLEAAEKALREERERVLVTCERGLRPIADAERRIREIDAGLARIARERRPAPEVIDAGKLSVRLAEPFAAWRHLSRADRRRLLAAGVEAVEIARAGVMRARVVAVRLRVPGLDPPRPRSPRLERPGTFGGTALRVSLEAAAS